MTHAEPSNNDAPDPAVKKPKGCLFKLLSCLVIAVVAAICALQVMHTMAWMPPTEQEWLNEQAANLRDIYISADMVAAAAEWSSDADIMGSTRPAQWQYHLSRREGVIPIDKEKGIGVYVVWHSFHDMEPRTSLDKFVFLHLLSREKRYVSDATLAIDQQGDLYFNDGHCCGALYLKSDKEVKTVADFLKTNMNGSGETTWKPYVGGIVNEEAR